MYVYSKVYWLNKHFQQDSPLSAGKTCACGVLISIITLFLQCNKTIQAIKLLKNKMNCKKS